MREAGYLPPGGPEIKTDPKYNQLKKILQWIDSGDHQGSCLFELHPQLQCDLRKFLIYLVENVTQ